MAESEPDTAAIVSNTKIPPAMLKPTHVKALPGYRLRIRYSDGFEGEVDLSNLVGQGVFTLWNDYAAFERVHIGEHGQIAWNEEIDLCADALYLQMTGKQIDDVFSNEQAA
jgi:hypothetical protein